LGHVLMENRNGLLVQTMVTEANDVGSRQELDTKEFVPELRRMNIAPHVAQNNTNRASAIDQRTTQHPGYAISQRERKRVEESFGWMKLIGMLKKVKLRGLDKVGWLFTFAAAAYNLRRLQKLQAQATA
jgi:Transposase DDE domain